MDNSEKPLYEDSFLTIGTWLHSATVQLVIGTFFSILASTFLHWGIGLAMFSLTILISLASYIVLKK